MDNKRFLGYNFFRGFKSFNSPEYKLFGSRYMFAGLVELADTRDFCLSKRKKRVPKRKLLE